MMNVGEINALDDLGNIDKGTLLSDDVCRGGSGHRTSTETKCGGLRFV